MTQEHDTYGTPRLLADRLSEGLFSLAQNSPELDELILKLGAHRVGHFLATTEDPKIAERLREYLVRFWPDYMVLIDRLITAAKKENNEDLLSDFGQS